MAENLLDKVGHTSQFIGLIYIVLLHHIRDKFLDGDSLGLSDLHQLESVWRMLETVEKQIMQTRGLVEGIVKYGHQ